MGAALAHGRIEDLPQDLRDRWAAARVRAAHVAPYLTAAVLALEPVVVTGAEEGGYGPTALRAFPVDPGWHVHVDPRWLEATPPQVIAFWLVHQVGHLLRQHAERYEVAAGARPAMPGRERSREQARWGVAVDCEVNDDLPADLRTADALVPGGLGLPEGQPAEVYWASLAEVAPVRLTGVLDCGSGADGVHRGWDAGGLGMPDDEQRLLRRDVARQVATRAREAGDVPAGWARWAVQVLTPVVDWRRELSAAMRRGVASTVGRVDYTYQRPSRRAAAVRGVVLPALRQPAPVVTVVLDTSQSMAGGLLTLAVAEVGGVLRAVGVGRRDLRVLCCDSAAYDSGRVLDAHRVEVVGGGGTDLREGLAAAAVQRPRPDLLVVLTDGGTDWPDRAPRHCAVVVGLLDSRRRPPAWAQTVDIPAGGG
jgi:predicted metal-dependent peptidase